MNCRSFLRYFSAYLEGELEGERLTESEAHLERCEKCARRVKAYRQGLTHLHDLPAVEPPPDLYFRVKRASYAGAASTGLGTRRLRLMIPAAAAAVITLAVALFFIDTGNERQLRYGMSAADSTVDVVNYHPAGEFHSRDRLGAKRQARQVMLASYAVPEDEPAFSYPVHTRPVFVLSGVAESGE
ncbi:MAG: zf-HC2 domain-containing protein [Candidatus Glassbacteria bacterium]|nr:zf-HC2 domain-containing protein [Candidatus Glassbacteria bacterium]